MDIELTAILPSTPFLTHSLIHSFFLPCSLFPLLSFLLPFPLTPSLHIYLSISLSPSLHALLLLDVDTGGVPWLDWLGSKLASDKQTSEGITPHLLLPLIELHLRY